MDLKAALVILFLWCISTSCNGVEGRTLSKEEDLELEKELKRLTKPAVATILTTYGDRYDCVDFYKQPAFDHPLLKNHSYHPRMKPTSYPTGSRHRNTSSVFRPENLWLNGKGCPKGTVPIRRVTKDDLIRAKLAAEIYASNLNPHQAIAAGVHFAGVSTIPKKYYGAEMISSLYNPLLIGGSQYSSSHIKIQNNRDLIIFGWTVNHGLYKDNYTHLFIYTDGRDKHCYNNFCGAFILNIPYVPLDFALQTTPKGGPVHFQHFFVYKDKVNGDWFYQIQVGSDYSTEVGWWPQRFFTNLADYATSITWGGEVYSPADIPTPAMGSGNPPYGSTWSTDDNAFCARMTVVDETHQIVNATDLIVLTDIGQYYRVKDAGYVDDYFQHVMLYGGAGGYRP